MPSVPFPCPHCGSFIDRPPADPDATAEENPFVPPAQPVVTPRIVPTDGGRPMLVLSLVAPYAVLMTIIAATFAYKFYTSRFEHPLAVIPDLVGEYRNATTRKSGARSVPMPRPDQPLPASLITSLDAPLRVGQIEVTPLKIERRAWTAYSKKKGKDEPTAVAVPDTLVMTLRIKNTSSDAFIYPMDPYFDRRPQDDDRALPYTLIEVNGKAYFGGIISYEPDRGSIEREYLEGREADNMPLQPGESRDVVVVTRPSYANTIIEAMRTGGTEATWRVHIRRGFYEFNEQEYSVAAVVGVRFSFRDISL